MGNKNRTILTLNGRHYDAVTGEIVPITAVNKTHAVRPIDDVVVVKPTQTHSVAASTPVSKPQHLPNPSASKKVMDVHRAPHHVKHHQQQHASTLMRTSVQKPSPGFKRHVKSVTRTDILAKSPAVMVAQKWSFHNIDPKRLARAKRVAKSQLIRKFSPVMVDRFVLAHPIRSAAVNLQPAVSSSSQSRSQSMDIFERAIAQSTSHEAKPVNPKKLAKAARTHAKQTAKVSKGPLHHRATSVLAASIAVLLLTGFIAFQNKANLTLRYASAQAGFHATLPGYKPAGFAIGKFSYGAGFVNLGFHNGSSGRDFSVSQQTTQWNSQTLLDNYVATNNHSYQTLQSSDKTIYIYGNNDASWVTNGVWYQLKSNGALSTSDILSVASSM